LNIKNYKYQGGAKHFKISCSIFRVEVEGISHGSYAKKYINKLCDY